MAFALIMHDTDVAGFQGRRRAALGDFRYPRNGDGPSRRRPQDGDARGWQPCSPTTSPECRGSIAPALLLPTTHHYIIEVYAFGCQARLARVHLARRPAGGLGDAYSRQGHLRGRLPRIALAVVTSAKGAARSTKSGRNLIAPHSVLREFLKLTRRGREIAPRRVFQTLNRPLDNIKWSRSSRFTPRISHRDVVEAFSVPEQLHVPIEEVFVELVAAARGNQVEQEIRPECAGPP